jgi:ABC-type branched-subunit amino acid transport system substrate-binding protein
MPDSRLSRRRLLAAPAATLACAAVGAQPRAAARPLAVAQIVDTSAAQQDVSKDFLIGARAAWQELNLRGGVRGRPVQHQVLEVDGSAASVRAALEQARDNPACMLLSGTVGDRTAAAVVAQLRTLDTGLAHAAPWLQNSLLDLDERTFPIFAGRQEQVVHALRSLTGVGIGEAGAIYATDEDWRLHREETERTAAGLKLRLQTFRADGDLTRLGQRLTPGTPAVLLFVGGTPELLAFLQGLEKQQRQRYVVALADVNLQVLSQLTQGRSTPVIATQPVPVTSAALPVVRAYREALARLFDEPPASLSLAGWIAARYAAEVLAELEQPTRAGVLAALQKRAPRDLGGFRVAYDERRRSATFVTQSLLTPDGRIVG